MIFSIDEEIFGKFPHLCLGVLIAEGLDNGGDAAELRPLLSSQQEAIRANTSIEILSEIPKIASWRRAYSAFGAKPKKYKSSVESLCRMILRGIDLRHINPIVDVYNYISVKHMVPVGGDDISRVEGDITLRFSSGGEMFRPLNSEDLEYTREGEVIYADDVDILCRRWNWRECDKTKMTEETKKAILVVEGLPPVDREEAGMIVEELGRLVKKFCGGKTRVEILHTDKPKIGLSQ